MPAGGGKLYLGYYCALQMFASLHLLKASVQEMSGNSRSPTIPIQLGDMLAHPLFEKENDTLMFRRLKSQDERICNISI